VVDEGRSILAVPPGKQPSDQSSSNRSEKRTSPSLSQVTPEVRKRERLAEESALSVERVVLPSFSSTGTKKKGRRVRSLPHGADFKEAGRGDRRPGDIEDAPFHQEEKGERPSGCPRGAA